MLIMDFCEDSFFKIVEEATQGGDVNISDIPDIELYIDQVTTFIDNKLGYNKRTLKDNVLTKTMINNYTKSKILPPPKNKKYSRQHMILLIFIYYLKQVLSINDINTLFTPLFKKINPPGGGMDYLGSLYNSFLQIKESSTDDLNEILSQKFKTINEKAAELPDDSEEVSRILLTVLTLVSAASIQKRVAEKIIDDYLKRK